LQTHAILQPPADFDEANDGGDSERRPRSAIQAGPGGVEDAVKRQSARLPF
jgi:hypothetical protein